MPADDCSRFTWSAITPLKTEDRRANGSLASLDALREEWERFLGGLSEAERVEIRQRSLRQFSIETGILERLYDIDWGMTLTLVYEGFAREVVERAKGAVDAGTLATLNAQKSGLEMVMRFLRDGRDLSGGFIKELHAELTRTQTTYPGRDALGRPVQVPLEHGAWKTQPNHVEFLDGTRLEYAPPEHVDSEIDRLTEMYRELGTDSVHPVIIAAWLHHRFVQIHPFADGNGRVARALTFLVLEKHRYAPIVVSRFHRDDYISALNEANQGNLGVLIRFFCRLASSSLTRELERPAITSNAVASTDAARTLAAQLRAVQLSRVQEAAHKLRPRFVAVDARVFKWCSSKRDELEQLFHDEGVDGARIEVTHSPPDDEEKGHWFRRQVIETAKDVGYFADLSALRAWTSIRVFASRVRLRFIVSLHQVGRDSRVAAVSTFADISTASAKDHTEGGRAEPERVRTTNDGFFFVHSEESDALDSRMPELEDMLDEGLAIALAALTRST